MRKIELKDKTNWFDLIKRPEMATDSLNDTVSSIIDQVEELGDKALLNYAREFDGVQLSQLTVEKNEIDSAIELVSDELKSAINEARRNIEKFHNNQVRQEAKIETTSGVTCWRESRAIERVGIYIPGGSAPLFSTILMLAIPAKIAGCDEIVLCTPPDKNGTVNPVILYVASLLGIDKIFKVGGAQAIAAMAFGTETIPQVYKIFGPGNQYVTKAKEMIQLTGVAIDMPAGPSEVLVLADQNANAIYVAADLLSQAEHGSDSQVVLVSDSEKFIDDVLEELAVQLEELPRKELAMSALNNSTAIICKDLEQGMNFSNQYAPEHLILATDNALEWTNKVANAGSVFVGAYSCESAGDYASGTNHTLPTNGFARNYSGVSVDSFVKKITFQNITKEGIRNIGPSIEIMAEAEGLIAHKNAVTVRLKN